MRSPAVLALMLLLLAGAAQAQDKPLVVGIYATPLEEPWPNVIHQALLAAETAGEITYKHTDNIGKMGKLGIQPANSGDLFGQLRK